MSNHQGNDNPRNMLVIKASAGSGKTYRLALEYIKHLLFSTSEDGVTLTPRRAPGDTRPLNAHRQMLAITFTNKATDEMKGRIVNELYRLSLDGVESDYLEGFMADSGLPEDEVRRLARLALNELMFDYSNFNVSTIDSFFQTILRNFARELDRDYNYDIQIDDKYAVRVAVHKFLLGLGRENMPPQVNKWVKDYMRHSIRDDGTIKKWRFFDDGGSLTRFAEQINTELFRSRMDAIRDYLGRKEDGRFICDFSRITAFKVFADELVKQLKASQKTWQESLRSELALYESNLSGNQALKYWYVKVQKAGDEFVPLTEALLNADETKITKQFLKNQVPPPDEITKLHGLVSEFFNTLNRIQFFSKLEDDLGLLGLLAMIDLYLEEYRHETNTILIADTNELIGAVLKSGSDFVFERVGTNVAHFMIDEFQDTSAKQYDNFKGLLAESLSHGHFNMLIGDAKQSIYRFRNADLTVFRDKVVSDFGDSIYDGNREPRPAGEPTSTNYRSSRNIIEFNNHLFEFLRDRFSDREAVMTTFADVRQSMPSNIDTDKVPGYVRLVTDNHKDLLETPDDAVANPTAAVFAALPAYLLRLHERYAWGDIGILVNSHKDGDKIVESVLEYNKQTDGEKIRIISGQSLLLKNSPVIRRIIAMLRFIDISQFTPDEEAADEERFESREDIIQWRIRRKRIGDQRMYTALNQFIKSVAAAPDASPSDYGELLAQSFAKADELATGQQSQQTSATMLSSILPPAGELTTLVSIVETIIAHFKRDSGGADVDRETAFLLAFQDTVMQFSSMRNGGSVREFLKFWDEKKDKLSVNSSSLEDAINIMTIHVAKGLEFKCVVIPVADWEIDQNSKEFSYWMPRDEFVDAMQALQVDIDPDVVPPLVNVNKKAVETLCEEGALGDGLAAAFVNKQRDDTLIDNLNKTYVAMTRPCSELHVFCMGKEHTVAPLLAEFAAKGGMMTPMMGHTGWYEMGEMPSADDFERLRQLKAQRQQQSDKRIKRSVSRAEITGYTVNDIPLTLRVKVDHASSSHIDAGLRLHSMMSAIRDKDDVERVIADAIKHGTVTDDPADPCGKDSVYKHVLEPINNEQCRVAAWFDPANKVYSERTITTGVTPTAECEDGVENLRPDRIVRRPDGQLLVIDYKSGKRDDKEHCRQVGRYMDKLRLIFPGNPVAGRIWYVTSDVIIDEQGNELPFTL